MATGKNAVPGSGHLFIEGCGQLRLMANFAEQLLDHNFICYDGDGQVPSQIPAHLPSNFKELRDLGKDHPALCKKTQGRWYVADPNKARDLETLRDKSASAGVHRIPRERAPGAS